MAKSDKAERLIAENRKAHFEYFIEERFEAGLVLQGWEVKAMRFGRAQLAEAYVYVRNEEVFLTGAHITPLKTTSTHIIADPVRTRKLLLNKSEISRLVGAVERKGYTLIPLDLHWKRVARSSKSVLRRARSSTTSARPRRIATGSGIRRASCAGASSLEKIVS